MDSKEYLQAAQDVVRGARMLLAPHSVQFLQKSAELLAECYSQGGKVLLAGNGGSLCDAMHFAEELTGQFRLPRKALPAIALADPSHLTCVGNDFGFEQVFSRGVDAFGKKGDVLIVLSTSGNSENIVRALDMAQQKEMYSIAFLGKTGGKAKGKADLEWIISGFAYSDRVQEVHMAGAHLLIEMLEAKLFASQNLSG